MHWGGLPSKSRRPAGRSSSEEQKRNSEVALNTNFSLDCDMTPNLKRLQLSKSEEELDGEICAEENGRKLAPSLRRKSNLHIAVVAKTLPSHFVSTRPDNIGSEDN